MPKAVERYWTRPPEVEAVLAVGAFLLFATVTMILLFRVVPSDNKDFAYAVLIALTGLVKDTFGRYFQATKGAQDQRREAADVAKTLAETAAATVAAANPLVVEAPAKVEITGAVDQKPV